MILRNLFSYLIQLLIQLLTHADDWSPNGIVRGLEVVGGVCITYDVLCCTFFVEPRYLLLTKLLLMQVVGIDDVQQVPA